MNHSFDVEEAKKYGVECAIILNNIRFWIDKNKANKKHFYDGLYWTYNSAKAFSELFPYFSEHQVRRFLNKLEQLGVIVCSNYNVSGYDKTKWYSVPVNTHFANLQDGLTDLPNGIDEIVRPIPYINTDRNNIDFDALLVFFNKVTSKKIKVVNAKAKTQLNARIKEGYTKQDIAKAITNCFNDKYHKENPHFLTLEFISRPDKFEKYFNMECKFGFSDEDVKKRKREELLKSMGI
jgi:uncharacterized phage protein (TIGR02220 family)